LRKHDPENQRTYLEETQGVTPPYLVVSQVWGEIKEYLTLPTVAWPVPISEQKKWDVIRDYCKKKGVKWLWMDILCINQSRSKDAEVEKVIEVPKMSHYYRDATACLVVPQNYETFSPAYSTIMHILFSIADTGASVKDFAEPIWDALASFEMVLDDAWLWRSWTFQELLLPKKHVLLDGQGFSIDDLERCFGWYFKMLRLETLEKPKGGREYSWIYRDDTGLRMSMNKGWGPLRMTWGLRTALQRDGYIDLLPAMVANSLRHCKFPVDRLLGIYGLLKEEDKLTTLHEPDTQDATTVTTGSLSAQDKKSSNDIASGVSPDQPSGHLSSSHQSARLEWLWKRTMVKTLTEGRVWPLLFDSMIPDAPKGTNWIPNVRGSELHEVWNQRNQRGMIVTEAGVHLTARVVGRISGMSASIGDGTGELNKVLACAWALMAKGFSSEPIMEWLEEGLANSSLTVPLEDVINAQTQLRQALHAPSLLECFKIVEKVNLRHKLFHGRSIAGWNRAVFTAQPGPSYSSTDGTYVFLGWRYSRKTADPEQCWILDVTAGSPDARRWVIANKIGPNTFHKIGSVAASSVPVFTTNHLYRRVILD
jgi:hypothetical protein